MCSGGRRAKSDDDVGAGTAGHTATGTASTPNSKQLEHFAADIVVERPPPRSESMLTMSGAPYETLDL